MTRIHSVPSCKKQFGSGSPAGETNKQDTQCTRFSQCLRDTQRILIPDEEEEEEDEEIGANFADENNVLS